MAPVEERLRAFSATSRLPTSSTPEVSAFQTVTRRAFIRKSSAVHPKAESEASVGVWTNTGSLCQVLMGRSEETPSTTTPRANRSWAGRGGGRLGVCKKNCKQMETLRILEERSRDGSADIWMFAISICCLWDLFSEAEQRGTEEEYQEEKKSPYILYFHVMDGFFISCFVSDSTWMASGEMIKEFISEAFFF